MDKKSRKRELIEPKGDKRYVRRNDTGKFEESDDVGRSLAGDRRRPAKKEVVSGQGDKGDQKRIKKTIQQAADNAGR